MDGLDCIEINITELAYNNDFFRIDSEFFGKYYNEINTQIKKVKPKYLSEYLKVLTDGKHGGVDFKNEGVVFLRNTNIKDCIIDITDVKYISQNESNETPRAELEENDLVLSTIGTVGLCVIIPPKFPKATINQNVVRIKIQDINPHFLCVFLNSKYGLGQTLRWAAGNVYQMINYPNLKKVLIPSLSTTFQTQIENTVRTAHNKIEESKNLYTTAETLLLSTLGLHNFTPSREAVNIKTLSDSFLASGRLDAEYYQVKYEEVVAKIKEKEYALLKELVYISKSIEPGSAAYAEDGETGLDFVRVADYNKYGLSAPQKRLSTDFLKHNNVDALKPKKGTILFSKDGSVGTAYLLRDNLNGITSGAILHLQVKNTSIVLPEYLTLALNSKLVQMQAERDAGGSIILHWRKEEIENVVVPIIDITTQSRIAALVQESFALKQASEGLLALAKQAVEVAIEEGEEAGLLLLANYVGGGAGKV